MEQEKFFSLPPLRLFFRSNNTISYAARTDDVKLFERLNLRRIASIKVSFDISKHNAIKLNSR